MELPMTEVIAVRRFRWVDQPNGELFVSIGKPQEVPGGAGEFYCPIQTTGFGDDAFIQSIYGCDGIQALELAIRYAGYTLSDIDAKNEGRLRWQFSDNGKLPHEWAQGDP